MQRRTQNHSISSFRGKYATLRPCLLGLISMSLGCGGDDLMVLHMDPPEEFNETSAETPSATETSLDTLARQQLLDSALERLNPLQVPTDSERSSNNKTEEFERTGEAFSQNTIPETSGDPSADPTEALLPDDDTAQGFWPQAQGVSTEDFEQLEALLDSVIVTGAGYAIGDIVFGSESDLLDFVSEALSNRTTKGLALAAKKWNKNTLSVCWDGTPGAGQVTQADQAQVAKAVEATWGQYGGLTFDWGSGNSFRSCRNVNGSLCLTTDATCTATQDIKIVQNDAVPWSFSRWGTDHLIPAIMNCGANASSPALYNWATMCLSSTNGPVISARTPGIDADNLLNYAFVHEFGHALALRHEQDHPGNPETNCAAIGTQSGDVTIGSFDEISVMSSCFRLNPSGSDLIPSGRSGELSEGDIESVQFLYNVPQTRVRFEVSSWYTSNVTATVTNGSINSGSLLGSVGPTPRTTLNGAVLNVGQLYEVSASASDSQLTCFANKPGAPWVFGQQSRFAIPDDFAANPVSVDCVDVAALSVLL